MKYILFTRANCSLCEQAKKYLSENSIQYKESELLTDLDIAYAKSFVPAGADGSVMLPIVLNSKYQYIGGINEMIRDNVTNKEQLFTKQTLSHMLTQGVCHVEFQKINGDLRKMRCTLNPSKLPLDPIIDGVKHTSKNTRPVNENLIAVFDLDLGEWRSFRVDSLKSITIEDNVRFD